MRITGDKIEIDYNKTIEFYVDRARKYDSDSPYISVLFQDDHPEIATGRNHAETTKILPKLNLTKQSRVLDIGCGVGRWADALPEDIAYYLGVDFSADMIAIAKQRNQRTQFYFENISAMECQAYCESHNLQKFTHVIISAMMLYINDEDVKKIMQCASAVTGQNAIFYVADSMGIKERLTLKDIYSEELKHEYNSIYRTPDEYRDFLTTYAPEFQIYEHAPLYEEAKLNNRKETAQYYFLLKR